MKWTQIAIERKWENYRYLLEHEMELLFPVNYLCIGELISNFGSGQYLTNESAFLERDAQARDSGIQQTE